MNRKDAPPRPPSDEAAPARAYVASADDAGQRLDNLLMRLDRGRPRSDMYRLIRTGQIRINGHRSSPSSRVREGDRIRLPPFFGRPPRPPAGLDAAWLEERVLHEDADGLVIDKPAGLAVHGGSGLGLGLVDLARARRPEAPLLAPVHRLDRETSGCLLLGKNRLALRRFQQCFREGSVEKIYLGLVLGRWPETLALIDDPLTPRPESDSVPAKPARTRVRVRERFAEATLLEFRLETGRTHQIRRHTADRGHPLAGDGRYGTYRTNHVWERRGLRRLFLHASRLVVPRLDGEGTIETESPLPADLVAVLEALRADRARERP